jgi:hypothetical protein
MARYGRTLLAVAALAAVAWLVLEILVWLVTRD